MISQELCIALGVFLAAQALACVVFVVRELLPSKRRRDAVFLRYGASCPKCRRWIEVSGLTRAAEVPVARWQTMHNCPMGPLRSGAHRAADEGATRELRV